MITEKGATRSGGLLLELPVPFRLVNGRIHAESQASNGLQRWVDNFQQVTVCAPLIPESLVDPEIKWQDIEPLIAEGRLTVKLLPWGYHPRDHFAHVKQVRATFRELIQTHRYLIFCNLGWLGAWGNTAAEQAVLLGRPYAVWLDWVLHDMPQQTGQNFLRNVWGRFNHWMLKRKSLSAIRQAALGLFHGRTVFDGYAAYSKNPQLVHDVHLKTSDIIDANQLAHRLEAPRTTFRIAYLGRVHPMKDPMAWISAIATLVEMAGDGYAIEAAWMGGGPLLEECRGKVHALNLDATISFPGVCNDRTQVLDFLRAADVFMFCHVTPESPRCLIEALMSGLPLIGFESEYAKDLIAHHGGGAFVPIGATRELAELACQIMKDKAQLASLTRQAYASGNEFSDEAVFKHRSELVKTYLTKA